MLFLHTFLAFPIPSCWENLNIIISAWILTDKMPHKTNMYTSYWKHVSSLRHTGEKSTKTRNSYDHICLSTHYFLLLPNSEFKKEKKKVSKIPSIFVLKNSKICDMVLLKLEVKNVCNCFPKLNLFYWSFVELWLLKSIRHIQLCRQTLV